MCKKKSGKHIVPSRSTIYRFLIAIDPEEIEKVFRAWIACFAPDDNGIAIDGKTMRGTSNSAFYTDGQGTVEIVNSGAALHIEGGQPTIIDADVSVTDTENGAVMNDATQALVTDVLRHISYSSASDNPPPALTFDWSFNDGSDGLASSAVSMNITGVNDTPVAVNDSYEITEGADINVISGNILNNDSDADGDTVTVSAVEATSAFTTSALNGAYGVINIAANGAFTYTLDNNHPDVNMLAAGESLNEVFSYTIDDGNGLNAQADLTIVINGIDNTLTIPVEDSASAPVDTSPTEGAQETASLFEDVSDASLGDSVTASTFGDASSGADTSGISTTSGAFSTGASITPGSLPGATSGAAFGSFGINSFVNEISADQPTDTTPAEATAPDTTNVIETGEGPDITSDSTPDAPDMPAATDMVATIPAGAGRMTDESAQALETTQTTPPESAPEMTDAERESAAPAETSITTPEIGATQEATTQDTTTQEAAHQDTTLSDTTPAETTTTDTQSADASDAATDGEKTSQQMFETAPDGQATTDTPLNEGDATSTRHQRDRREAVKIWLRSRSERQKSRSCSPFLPNSFQSRRALKLLSQQKRPLSTKRFLTMAIRFPDGCHLTQTAEASPASHRKARRALSISVSLRRARTEAARPSSWS